MNDLDLIETDRLVLSGWRADQADDLYRLHGDPVVAKYLSAQGEPWTKQAMDKALANWMHLFETVKMGKLRVRRKADNVLVGRAGYGIYAPTGEPELGYSLYPQHWGHGYAFEAASALRDWIFRDTEWDHFIGMADARNAPSIRILRGIGMTPTGQRATDEGVLFEHHIYHRPKA